MASDDQERFEDYLELEQYIEDLQAGRVAHPPENLTPAQARIYRMAALFRSGPPEAATPRPEFVEELRKRLLALDPFMEEEEDTVKRAAITLPPEQPAVQKQLEVPQQEAVQQPPVPARKEKRKRVVSVSRRGLLSRGAVAAAAASLAIGVGAGVAASQMIPKNPSVGPGTPTPKAVEPVYKPASLVKGGPTMLHYVTTLDQVGEGAVKFETDTVIGYIKRNDEKDKSGSNDQFIAVSAACTHMGCIVRWDDTDQQFHCPCHGGVFTEYGMPTNNGPVHYLTPLPRLYVQVAEDGKIYVEVPVSTR
jgi:Rieske Fe-S protein